MSEQKQLFDVQLPPPKTNSHESEYQKFKRLIITENLRIKSSGAIIAKIYA